MISRYEFSIALYLNITFLLYTTIAVAMLYVVYCGNSCVVYVHSCEHVEEVLP